MSRMTWVCIVQTTATARHYWAGHYWTRFVELAALYSSEEAEQVISKRFGKYRNPPVAAPVSQFIRKRRNCWEKGDIHVG